MANVGETVHQVLTDYVLNEQTQVWEEISRCFEGVVTAANGDVLSIEVANDDSMPDAVVLVAHEATRGNGLGQWHTEAEHGGSASPRRKRAAVAEVTPEPVQVVAEQPVIVDEQPQQPQQSEG